MKTKHEEEKKIGIVDFCLFACIYSQTGLSQKKSSSELTRVVLKHTSFHVQCLDRNTVTGERMIYMIILNVLSFILLE